MPQADNYPRVLPGHRKVSGAVPIPPRDVPEPARDVGKPAGSAGVDKPARDVALCDVALMDVLKTDPRFSRARDVLAVFLGSKSSTASSSGAGNSNRLTPARTQAGTADHQAGGQTDGHDD
jgi:hypothetical protein